jgi:hypothetical protein
MKHKKLFKTPDIFEYAIKNMNIKVDDIIKAKNNNEITEKE